MTTHRLGAPVIIGGISDPALMITVMALHRVESRGAQARTDFPHTGPAWAHSTSWTLADAFAAAQALLPYSSPSRCGSQVETAGR